MDQHSKLSHQANPKTPLNARDTIIDSAIILIILFIIYDVCIKWIQPLLLIPQLGFIELVTGSFSGQGLLFSLLWLVLPALSVYLLYKNHKAGWHVTVFYFFISAVAHILFFIDIVRIFIEKLMNPVSYIRISGLTTTYLINIILMCLSITYIFLLFNKKVIRLYTISQKNKQYTLAVCGILGAIYAAYRIYVISRYSL